MRRLLYILLFIFSASVSRAESCSTTSDTLVGEWQCDSRKMTFMPDGVLAIDDDGYEYSIFYRFSGVMLYEIQRADGVEYIDYYTLCFLDNRTKIGLVHYEYVHKRVTGEYWDPEIMTFSEELAERFFAKYLEDFKASGEAADRWFDIYDRGACW